MGYTKKFLIFFVVLIGIFSTGVFSYNARQVEMIKNYVNRQKEHHRQKSFKTEYVGLLKEFEVDYKEEYLFDWIRE